MEEMMEKLGMGWLPDLPDFRDYTAEQDEVTGKLRNLGQKDSIKGDAEKSRCSQSDESGTPPGRGLKGLVFPSGGSGPIGFLHGQRGSGGG